MGVPPEEGDVHWLATLLRGELSDHARGLLRHGLGNADPAYRVMARALAEATLSPHQGRDYRAFQILRGTVLSAITIHVVAW